MMYITKKKQLLGLGLMLTICLSACHSTGNNMKTEILMAKVFAKPEKTEEVKALLQKNIGFSLQEEGCAGFTLQESTEEAGTFLLYEQWKTRTAWQEHMEMPYLKDFVAKSENLLSKSFDLTWWQILDGASLKKSPANSKWVLTVRFSVQPGKQAQAENALVQVGKDSFTEKECTVFEVLKSTENDTDYLLYEEWDSYEAWGKHMELDYIQDFVAMIDNTFSKAPVREWFKK
jgi:quinol monooxygenase YgiN